MRDWQHYSIIVKNADNNDEIIRTKIKDVIKGEDIIIIGCEAELFKDINRVIVVFHADDEAFLYRGTVRKTNHNHLEVMIALYKKEEINNREQQRYMLMANVQLLRYIRNGELTELNPLVAGNMLDISTQGARLQLSENVLAVGDFVAFRLMNNALNKILLGRVVRIAADEENDHQYGLLLIDSETA